MERTGTREKEPLTEGMERKEGNSDADEVPRELRKKKGGRERLTTTLASYYYYYYYFSTMSVLLFTAARCCQALHEPSLLF